MAPPVTWGRYALSALCRNQRRLGGIAVPRQVGEVHMVHLRYFAEPLNDAVCYTPTSSRSFWNSSASTCFLVYFCFHRVGTYSPVTAAWISSSMLQKVVPFP